MGTIHTSDILFATLSCGHNTISRRILTGIASVAEIVKLLRPDSLSRFGLYTLEVRNSTAGWSHRKQLTFGM